MDQNALGLLKSELKQNLRITWDDEDTNLEMILKRSEAYLNEITGASFDFQTELRAKDLLLERCRYVYNNVSDEFEKNFRTELSRFILESAVRKASETDETTS
jgi:hypothetical protein